MESHVRAIWSRSVRGYDYGPRGMALGTGAALIGLWIQVALAGFTWWSTVPIISNVALVIALLIKTGHSMRNSRRVMD
jgi:hypothetical protein